MQLVFIIEGPPCLQRFKQSWYIPLPHLSKISYPFASKFQSWESFGFKSSSYQGLAFGTRYF